MPKIYADRLCFRARISRLASDAQTISTIGDNFGFGDPDLSRAATPMMQAAYLWNRDDCSTVGRFDVALERRVAI